jgi:hypothetical protein
MPIRHVPKGSAPQCNAEPAEVDVVETILKGERVGSGLKTDMHHRAAGDVGREQLESGRVFTISSGDRTPDTLLQTQGKLGTQEGVYEYIIDQSGRVTHQRFIKGGVITGTPNQKVPKSQVPKQGD